MIKTCETFGYACDWKPISSEVSREWNLRCVYEVDRQMNIFTYRQLMTPNSRRILLFLWVSGQVSRPIFLFLCFLNSLCRVSGGIDQVPSITEPSDANTSKPTIAVFPHFTSFRVCHRPNLSCTYRSHAHSVKSCDCHIFFYDIFFCCQWLIDSSKVNRVTTSYGPFCTLFLEFFRLLPNN